MDINIVPLQEFDREALGEFFDETIRDSFAKEGFIGPGIDKILEFQIRHQAQRVDSSIKTGDPQFLLAKDNGRIVGVVAFGKPEEAVLTGLKKLGKTTDGLVEIMASFVRPDRQKQGIGTRLFQEARESIKKQGYRGFAVNTGYKNGYAFWKKLLGAPDTILDKFYDPIDCWVWVREG